jgi:heat shock protein HslJ
MIFVEFGCVEHQPVNVNLEGNKFKLSERLSSFDDFFTIEFGEKTLEGKTISNTFSANYEIVGNRVNISNFISTGFEEKDLDSKHFLSLFSNSFDCQKEGNKLIVSNSNLQMILSNTNSDFDDETLFYYYFADSIYITLDTTQLYLKFNTNVDIMSKDDLVSLFQTQNIEVDTFKTYFFNNNGNIAFISPVNSNEYRELLEVVNAMNNVEYATPCFTTNSSSAIYLAWTNYILVSTALNEVNIRQTLTDLDFPSYELENHDSYWGIKLTNIQTGFEPLYWANVLHNITDYEYATISNIYLQNF